MAIKDRNGALHSEKNGQFVSKGGGNSSGFDVEKLEKEHRGRLSTIVVGSGEPIKIAFDFFSEKAINTQTVSQLKKGIKSKKKKIELHRLKIRNPENVYPEWNEFDEARKQRELRHWQKEINTHIKEIKDRERMIREKETGDE